MARICIMWIVAYRRAGSLSHDQFPTHCVSHFPHHPQPHHHTTTLHFPNFAPHTTVFKLCTPHQIHCAPHPPHRVHFAPHSTSARAPPQCKRAPQQGVRWPPLAQHLTSASDPASPLTNPPGLPPNWSFVCANHPSPPSLLPPNPQAKQTQMQRCSPASYM